MKKIGIVAALPDEAGCLVSEKITPFEPIQIQDNIYLCLSGMGYNNALKASAELLRINVDALISWGVAGAVNESLHSGDILIAEQILAADGQFQCSPEWHERLLIALSSASTAVFNSKLYSDDRICASISDKQKLFAKTKADAVDMESAAIAGLAEKMNIDFVAIRAVADEAVTSLPKAVTKHTDEFGQPRLMQFLLSCLFNPGQILSLLILARAYKKALANLKGIANDLKKQEFHYNTPA